MKLTKRWSWFLVAFGVWSWAIWPNFMRNIAKDDRAFDDGTPQAFFVVHLVLTLVSLAAGTAIGVLGIKGLRRARTTGKGAVDELGSRTTPDRDRAGAV
jgi:hypothetical protein